jgi:hypothetical protein
MVGIPHVLVVRADENLMDSCLKVLVLQYAKDLGFVLDTAQSKVILDPSIKYELSESSPRFVD